MGCWVLDRVGGAPALGRDTRAGSDSGLCQCVRMAPSKCILPLEVFTFTVFV